MLSTFTITGYEITEVAYESLNTIIYRGVSLSTGQKVILKALKAEYPSLEQITRLKHEYQVTENLDLEGVVKVHYLEKYQNRFVLVAEDFGGISLKEFLVKGKLPLLKFLTIAVQLAKSLVSLHNNKIIHKDIKPANIIINPESGQVKLTDFSIATRLSNETIPLINPNQLEGTLAYMSPEQTGRMNRSVDFRSDFYSLGVTFYELLTGKLPFVSNDQLEIVYCHLAVQPTPIDKLNPEIPQAIIKIINKLMAKNAEDRYQSATGVLGDLQRCLYDFKTTGEINYFTLGELDKTSQLLIPQKLYGREKQVEQLLQIFERVSQGSLELVLVSGYSGIGKTALINEVVPNLTRKKGYLSSGKFDQFQRNVPLSAPLQAHRGLIRQLLTESQERLQYWKKVFLNALGNNAQVIIDAIPELELIIGKQPPVPELGAMEAANRLVRTFNQFDQALLSQEHPLVMFIDDMQWVDTASLQSLQSFCADTNSLYSLVILAYRDNEVSSTHPFIQTVEAIRKAGVVKITEINLEPLNLENVTQLVADTLHACVDKVTDLAKLLFEKTQGNPFFLTQLLKSLHEEKLLWFETPLCSPLLREDGMVGNEMRGVWQWDLEKIKQQAISDNVVELMVGKIHKLPASTQRILQLSACIGNQFNLNTLTIVNEKSWSDTARDLWPALQVGLIVPVGDDYKLPQVLNTEEIAEVISQGKNIQYRFLHDRVQQAAYALIPDSQKQTTHYQIGRLFLQTLSPEALEAQIFDVVNHLNIGIDLIEQTTEKVELAKLNLVAGKRAKASAAYKSTFKYINTGLSLLPQNTWEIHYTITLALYEAAVEAAYLCGEFEQMSQQVEVVQKHAQTVLDVVKVYESKILAHLAQKKLPEAVAAGLEILALLGLTFPNSPSEGDVGQALAEVLSLIPQTGISSLLDLAPMTNRQSLAILQILNSIVSATYCVCPPLFALNILAQVKLSIKSGNVALSAFSYGLFASLLCASGDIESGYQFGNLALQLLDKLQDKTVAARVLLSVTSYSKHWKSHLNKSLPLFQAGTQAALEIGDLEFIAWHDSLYCRFSYWTGQTLSQLESQIVSHIERIRSSRQEVQLNHTEMIHQVVLNLRGHSIHPCQLTGEVYDEVQSLANYQIYQDGYGLYALHLHKLILNYLFEQHTQAKENATKASEYLAAVASLPELPYFHFYDSLTRLALYSERTSTQKDQDMEQVSANQAKMQHWTHHAPMNYLHKFYLVEAEKYRVLGQVPEAMNYYDLAIQGALENDYIQEAALANELAAKFYLSLGKKKIAKVYITEAYYYYTQWGATAKVKDLEKRYPNLINRTPNEQFNSVVNTSITKTAQTTSSTSTSCEFLDFATVIKASEAIQSENSLDKLPETILHIILENAGAQKGCLILDKSGKLYIEAIDSNQESIEIIRQSTPVETSENIPISLINYVARTQQPLVINNATIELKYQNDLYIQRHQPKSILCSPIFYQGEFIGLFYLENNLVTGAFTTARLELLKALSSQAAIAITNARLYAQQYSQVCSLQQAQIQLKQQEEQYRTIFESANDGLSIFDIKTYNFVEVNPKNCQIYGYTFEEFINLQPQDYIHPDSLPLFEKFIAAMKASREFSCEAVLIHKNGTFFDVDVKATTCMYNGKVHGLVITRDISERKKAEKALQQKTLDLEQALFKLQKTQSQLVHTEKISSLGQLVAGVAHEVNNPVSFINGNLTHVKQYVEDLMNLLNLYQKYLPEIPAEIEEEIENIDLEYLLEDLPKMISSMKIGTTRIKEIMQSLRNFSRNDGDDKRAANIHEGIDATLMILSHRLKANPERPAIQIIKEYGDLPLVECFPGQLNQVFMNLTANAIDAFEEFNQGKRYQEINNIITIRTAVENGWITISISDNGMGMSEEVRQKLFNAFFTTKPEGKGTGLGLSISYQIVTEKHGGSLDCVSSPGNGATFIIRIPLK